MRVFATAMISQFEKDSHWKHGRLGRIGQIEEKITILHTSCTLRNEMKFRANSAHILRIGEISTTLRKSCTYIQSCANLAHILRIGERSRILRKSCPYIAH